MREIKFRWWVTSGEDFEDKFFDAEGNVIPHMETDLAVPEYMPINDQINAKGAIPTQYVGRIDKEEKEIYEGDIVHFKVPGLSGLGIVFYDEKTAQFKINDIRYRTKGRIYPFYDDATYRVDGNIYENPELLEANE